jgi:ABC-type Na+ efflux pump permease subunit
MSKSNKKTSTNNKQKKSVRLIALILAGLMVIGVATIGISLLASTIANGNDTHQHQGHTL